MESVDSISLQQQVNELLHRVQILESEVKQQHQLIEHLSKALDNEQSQIKFAQIESDLRRKEKEDDAKRARETYKGKF
ncbi:hypothetical protein NDI44_17860 [Trichocoleus sp. DQ-A3]|uniref:hypothetical protein n=1 Tax=Cyanophyceae TaxID=3028117 RepID=UPI001683DDA6|nr:hypothetical protein [Coleofasciculus sp. FACHB-125]MBD1899682.1 hypothetical protein [Coleofasciculus sp. FACHB-125]